MEKKLQDYIHFYLGQEAEGFWTEEDGSNPQSEGIGKIVKVATKETCPPWPVVLFLSIRRHNDSRYERHFDFNQVKPLLRPLSDMTDEEAGWVWSYSFESGLTTQLGTFFDFDIHKVKDGNEVVSLIIKRTDRPDHAVNISLDGTSIVYHDGDINKPPIFCWRCVHGAIQFRFLLSCGFDLFGLIPAGLALDKTKRLSESKEGER